MVGPITQWKDHSGAAVGVPANALPMTRAAASRSDAVRDTTPPSVAEEGAGAIDEAPHPMLVLSSLLGDDSG